MQMSIKNLLRIPKPGRQQQRTFAKTVCAGAVCAGAVCAGACVIFAATLHRCSNFAATSQQRTG